MSNRRSNNLPDCPVEILDDAEARRFLGELDLLKHLPVPSSLSLRALFASYDGHITHWIVGVRFEGYDKPEDNGYGVYCFPKSQYTWDVVQAWIKRFFVEAGSDIDSSVPFIRL